ncbi:MAG: TonB-dependent receptor [Pseudomonadota bacterium]
MSDKFSKILRNVLLGGVSTMAVAALATPALAQSSSSSTTATTTDSDTIVVTGLRGSLQRSLDIKRNAVGVVDAISAEDIGKFPDSNLAAAIQRIPGISVSRGVSSLASTGGPSSMGNATEITVRGFGPSFNQTLFDGREQATGTSSRAFDFSSVGADFVGQVDVLKTPDASMSSGAIGATINIQYPKPFDHPGMRLAASFAENYAPDEGEYTPNAGLLFSDTFNNDTFGILADIAYSDVKNRANHINIQGWEGTTASQFASTVSGTDPNKPAWFIQDYGIYQEHNEDKRVDGRVVLQWRPASDWLLTLNDNYSRDELTQHEYGFSVWFNAGSLQNVQLNNNGTVVDFLQPNTPTDFQGQINAQVIESNEVGFNARWDQSSNMSWIFDADHSESKLNPGGEYSAFDADVGYGPSVPGGLYGVGIGIAGIGSNSLPYPTGYGPAGDKSDFLDSTLLGSHVFPITSQQNDDKVDQIKIMGDWSADDLTLRFGIHYLEDEKQLSNYGNFGNNDWQAFAGYGPNSGNGTGHGVDLPDSVTNTFGSFSTSGFINGFSGAGNLPPNILVADPNVVLNYLQSLGAAAANPGCCTPAFDGTNRIALDPGSVQDIKEATTALFFTSDYSTKLADMPLRISAGARYEETHLTSDGIGRTPIQIQVQASDHTAYFTTFSATSTLSQGNTYRYLLPNLDVNLSLTDDIKLRLDASRTLTRPPLNFLTPDVNFSGSPRVGALGGSGGNPDLLPYLSDNLDIGLEWYYAPNSYVSGDVFVKEVTNFIVGGTTSVTLNAPILDAGGTQTAATSTWTVTSNVNGPSAEIRGLELAWQHLFGDTGFGFQANATFVDTDKPYDTNNLSVSGFAVTGLANSANLVAFYDKNGLQGRIAVNWRDEYLDHFGQLQNGAAVYGSEPTFVNAATTVDASTSYDINDHFQVYFEGLNLTNETYSTHGRFAEQILDAVDFGRRFTLGVHVRY